RNPKIQRSLPECKRHFHAVRPQRRHPAHCRGFGRQGTTSAEVLRGAHPYAEPRPIPQEQSPRPCRDGLDSEHYCQRRQARDHPEKKPAAVTEIQYPAFHTSLTYHLKNRSASAECSLRKISGE